MKGVISFYFNQYKAALCCFKLEFLATDEWAATIVATQCDRKAALCCVCVGGVCGVHTHTQQTQK